MQLLILGATRFLGDSWSKPRRFQSCVEDCIAGDCKPMKLIDVYPDGRAYNLDETIQRLRYRDGYDKPKVWIEPGKVYKVILGPMNTSNYFEAGHRIRIEVSSSNFSRFDRNLNTGGRNYDETKSIVARNAVHHSRQYPSSIKITVVRKPLSSRK